MSGMAAPFFFAVAQYIAPPFSAGEISMHFRSVASWSLPAGPGQVGGAIHPQRIAPLIQNMK